jgi:DNA polymerase-1
VAATGRLSSKEPNLQNIPIRTEEGRKIRHCFIARSGHVFVSADYSQIELRILAHLCGEGPLLEAFNKGEDIHRRTAAEVFGISQTEVSPEQRRAAKAINFGILYGMGPTRLADELKISKAQAQSYIEGYFARQPQVRSCLDKMIQQARDHGYSLTMFGRRRPVAGITASNPMDRAAAERIAINTPVQGTAADLIKLAMIRAKAALAGLSSKLILQVHDELLFETPLEEVSTLSSRIREAMEGVASLKLPLKVDIHSGPTWDTAH